MATTIKVWRAEGFIYLLADNGCRTTTVSLTDDEAGMLVTQLGHALDDPVPQRWLWSAPPHRHTCAGPSDSVHWPLRTLSARANH
jgi:hypothetical protein